MTAASILFKASLVFTHASSFTRLLFPTQAGRLRRGRRNLEDRFRYSYLDTERRPRLILPARVNSWFSRGLNVGCGKHSPNPFVVPRFIGAGQRNLLIDRMNAVTTNGLGECLPAVYFDPTRSAPVGC